MATSQLILSMAATLLYNPLTPVYHGFTEGFDTEDLQEAKMLLDELNGA